MYASTVAGLHLTPKSTDRQRADRSATVGSGAGAGGTGSSPCSVRSMTSAAARLRSLIVSSALARANRHQLKASGSLGLYDIDLVAGGVDPHVEAGQVAVPEDRVVVGDSESVHFPLCQSKRAALGMVCNASVIGGWDRRHGE